MNHPASRLTHVVQWFVFALPVLTMLPAPAASQGTPAATPAADSSGDCTHCQGDSARRGEADAGPIDLPVELWRYQADGSCSPSPAVVGGTVYAGCDDDTLYAFDAGTGEIRWRFTAEPMANGPSIADDVAYVVGTSGTLYGVDIATGTERWRHEGAAVLVSPVVADGLIVVPKPGGLLVGLETADGAERWSYQVTEGGDLNHPALLDGIAYVGSQTGDFTAIDADTGELIWTVDTGDSPTGSAVVADGIAYIGAPTNPQNATLAAYDAETGELLWQRDDPMYSPAVSNGIGYSSSGDGTIYAFDTATGDELWRAQVGRVARPLIVAGDIVYVPSDGDRAVYAFDAATGAERWRLDVEGGIGDQMAVSGGRIYVTTLFGFIQAFGDAAASTGPLPASPVASPRASGNATPADTAATPVASTELATFLWASTGGGDDATLDQPTGVAIAPDGTIWVGNGGRSRFELFSPDGTHIESWGEPGNGDGQFSFTNSDGSTWGTVAFAPDGTFYIADFGNSRIQRFDADRQFLDAWGSFGSEDGEFIAPLDLAVDSQGNVFVNDYLREDVQKFAADGTYLLTFGERGSEPGQLLDQWMMTIAPDDTVWVADGGTDRVQQWDNNGQFLTAHDAGGTLGDPTAVAIDEAGNIYVCDMGGVRVVVLDPSGTVIGQFGVEGTGDGQFVSPEGMALDREQGTVYVIDFPESRLVAFQLLPPLAPEASLAASTPAATPVASTELATFLWETSGGDTPFAGANDVVIAPDGTVWVANGDHSQFEIFAPDGTFLESWGEQGDGEGQFNFLRDGVFQLGDVAFAPDGSFYVTDAGNHRIQHFDANRQFLYAWGEPGTGDGQFLSPWDLALDSQGNVFVNDDLREDVQKFTPDGTYLLSFGGGGSAPGQLSYQWSMTIDGEDRAWVADGDNGRIQVWDNDGQFIAAHDADGTLGYPTAVAVDSQGRIFVIDAGGPRVVVLDSSGAVIGQWGEFGPDEGGFVFPEGIALDGEGGVYVLDHESDRLLKFQLLPPLAPEASPVADVTAATPVASTELATFLWETSGGDTPFEQPGHITISPDGTIWVSGGTVSEFQLFTPDGAFVETWGEPGEGDGQFNFVQADTGGFGAVAFAPDGTFYVADTGNYRIQHFDADRQFLDAWGGFGTGDGEFICPIDVAVDSQGNVFVNDTRREDIQKFAPDGRHLVTMGGHGSEPGQLAFQGWMTIASDDTIWVADSGNGRVQQWDNDGQFLAAHDGGGAIVEPWDIAVDGQGRLYIADVATGQILVLDETNNVVGSWGSSGVEGKLTLPGIIALDGQGNVHVVDYLEADSYSGRVVTFQLLPPLAPEASPVTSTTAEFLWQSTGGPDPLLAPHGMAIDLDGNLWVADGGNNRFQILSPEGEHLETWGTAGDGDGEFGFNRTPADPFSNVASLAFDPNGAFYVIDFATYRIQKFDADREFVLAWGGFGPNDGEFINPYAVAVAPDGNVYVVDYGRIDIQVFDANGTYLFTFGEAGSGPGQFANPGGLTIDSDGSVYLADFGNNRILKFASDGTFISTFGELGTGAGQLDSPSSVAVDQAGNIYVTEVGNGRVQVFSPDGESLVTWSHTDAAGAAFNVPLWVDVDDEGGVYVSDIEAGTVQKYQLEPPLAPCFAAAAPYWRRVRADSHGRESRGRAWSEMPTLRRGAMERYITDAHGVRTAVILDIEDFKALMKAVKDADDSDTVKEVRRQHPACEDQMIEYDDLRTLWRDGTEGSR